LLILGGLTPGMAQYRVLASEGRQRYRKTQETLKIYRKKTFGPCFRLFTLPLDLQRLI
jgi:hypothetical protein